MYKIIKLQNNNDLNNFYLDITKMKDVRIRIGILVSYYKYKNTNLKNKNHPVFKTIEQNDFSFSVIYRSSTDTYEEILKVKKELEQFYLDKYRDQQPKITKNVLSFS